MKTSIRRPVPAGPVAPVRPITPVGPDGPVGPVAPTLADSHVTVPSILMVRIAEPGVQSPATRCWTSAGFTSTLRRPVPGSTNGSGVPAGGNVITVPFGD